MSCAGTFKMLRGEYEQYVSRERGQTLATLGEIGFVSFPCTDCGDTSCLGWGHVRVPENGAGEIVILDIIGRGVARDDIHPIGGRSTETKFGRGR